MWCKASSLSRLANTESHPFPDCYAPRQYGTFCNTATSISPNSTIWERLQRWGIQVLKDDETFMKIPSVMLGAPAQKEMWRHSIWPGTLPALPMIGLRFNTFFQVYGKSNVVRLWSRNCAFVSFQ
jgi:hypothetical protein